MFAAAVAAFFCAFVDTSNAPSKRTKEATAPPITLPPKSPMTAIKASGLWDKRPIIGFSALFTTFRILSLRSAKLAASTE